jgi:hypothetical protein
MHESGYSETEDVLFTAYCLWICMVAGGVR